VVCPFKILCLLPLTISTGEKARDVFVKSKLSNEQLLKIWCAVLFIYPTGLFLQLLRRNLADTQDRGSLDSVDFAIGMYFIQGVMTGKISFIPTTLPPGLYQQAGGVSNTGSIRSHITGGSGSFSPIGSTFAAQHTGQSPSVLQPDYTGVQPFRAPTLPARPNTSALANGHTVDWDVTPAEKASSDRYFDTLDTQKRGFIEGDVAVPFMLKSQLPGDVLAHVW
jgi:epidermal growth factor receptor substrate 15